MTGWDLINSMEYVDDRFIDAAEYPYGEKSGRARRFRPLLVAACLLLVISIPLRQFLPFVVPAGAVWNMFYGEREGGTAGEETSAYETVYMTHPEQELISPPSSWNVGVYCKNNMVFEIDKPLDQWAAPYMERMCKSLRISMPDEIKYYDEYEWYAIGPKLREEGDRRTFTVSRPGSIESKHQLYDLQLDGEQISIDLRQSREQNIASLASIRNKLFAIFNVDFPDVKITKSYNVYFYDASAHPLNRYEEEPVSDYIRISFDNYANWEGDIVSNDVLINSSITYCQYRMSPDTRYLNLGWSKMLSLEKAEEMLEGGYYFSPTQQCDCTLPQPKVDVTDYDYVGFEYVQSRGFWNLLIPFYTFYTKTADCADGGDIYAKVYVCAVESPGLKGHFDWMRRN